MSQTAVNCTNVCFDTSGIQWMLIQMCSNT